MLLPAQQQEHPMPPQQTKLRSGTRRNAAGLRLVVASAENTTGGALAAARPDASTASSAASTRNVLSLLQRCWRAFWEWRQRERLRTSLHSLNARELEDIGLTQGNIDYIVARQTLERLRDGTAHLWPSRGVM
jgi:uncharacterized protein YjiS (DUF1127 family)